MKQARTMGLVAFAGVAILLSLAAVRQEDLYAQRISASRGLVGQGDLIALDGPTLDGYQLVTLVDRQKRVMSVYHIDVKSGQITLKSVRNVSWDFDLDDFNGADPTPHDIRSLLQTQ